MIARRWLLVCLAVTVGIAALCHAGGKDLPPGAMQLRGAGSTFAAPLQKKWREAYQKRHPEVVVSYEAVGSGEGTKQFLAGTVDFGASDAALSDAQLTAVTAGAQLVPIMAGSIVLAYSHSRRRRMLLKINDLFHLAFANIKSIESTTYAFYATSNGQVLN
jgi:phosphate transport system substrate-binding protein